MRAATDNRLLEVDPGATTSVVVDVVNTGAVIDGVTASVIGLAPEFVQTQPSLLPLFPATSGQLTVSLAVPPTHPAGRHQITVELVSHGAHLPAQYLDVDLDVSARPAMSMTPVPRVVRARRSGRFVLEVANTGNVPLDVTMQAVDVDRSIRATFTPPQLRVEPGSVAPVLLNVRGPRQFTGSEADRAVAVSATATRADLTGRLRPGRRRRPDEPTHHRRAAAAAADDQPRPAHRADPDEHRRAVGRCVPARPDQGVLERPDDQGRTGVVLRRHQGWCARRARRPGLRRHRTGRIAAEVRAAAGRRRRRDQRRHHRSQRRAAGRADPGAGLPQDAARHDEGQLGGHPVRRHLHAGRAVPHVVLPAVHRARLQADLVPERDRQGRREAGACGSGRIDLRDQHGDDRQARERVRIGRSR